MNSNFHWKWSFHVLILSPLQAWRKLIKNWWFLIDLCTLTSGHEIMNWNSLGFHETSDFGENSLCWLSRTSCRSPSARHAAGFVRLVKSRVSTRVLTVVLSSAGKSGATALTWPSCENHQDAIFVHFDIKFHGTVWPCERIPEIFPAVFGMKTLIRNKPTR